MSKLRQARGQTGRLFKSKHVWFVFAEDDYNANGFWVGGNIRPQKIVVVGAAFDAASTAPEAYVDQQLRLIDAKFGSHIRPYYESRKSARAAGHVSPRMVLPLIELWPPANFTTHPYETHGTLRLARTRRCVSDVRLAQAQGDLPVAKDARLTDLFAYEANLFAHESRQIETAHAYAEAISWLPIERVHEPHV